MHTCSHWSFKIALSNLSETTGQHGPSWASFSASALPSQKHTSTHTATQECGLGKQVSWKSSCQGGGGTELVFSANQFLDLVYPADSLPAQKREGNQKKKKEKLFPFLQQEYRLLLEFTLQQDVLINIVGEKKKKIHTLTFPRVLRHIYTKLDDVTWHNLTWWALLRSSTQSLTINKGTITTFSVLKIEL